MNLSDLQQNRRLEINEVCTHWLYHRHDKSDVNPRYIDNNLSVSPTFCRTFDDFLLKLEPMRSMSINYLVSGFVRRKAFHCAHTSATSPTISKLSFES